METEKAFQFLISDTDEENPFQRLAQAQNTSLCGEAALLVDALTFMELSESFSLA